MALRLRRGTNADRLTVTPAEGELLYTTDSKKIYAGDGSTVGGNIVSGINNLLEDLTPQLGGDLDLNAKSIVGNGNIDITGSITAPAFTGDFYGSVFGDDSELLVDVINSKIVLSNNVLADLSDVQVTGIQTGQVLKWNGNNWYGATDSQVNLSAESLNSLGDVTVDGVQLGQVLAWGGSEWTSSELNLSQLADVNTNNAVQGYSLIFDGVNWQAGQVPVPDINNIRIDDLANVSAANPNLNDVLSYNLFTNNWVNKSLTLDDIANINLNGLQLGNILTWDGFNWVPGGGIGDLTVTDIQGSVYGDDSTYVLDTDTSTLRVINVEVLPAGIFFKASAPDITCNIFNIGRNKPAIFVGERENLTSSLLNDGKSNAIFLAGFNDQTGQKIGAVVNYYDNAITFGNHPNGLSPGAGSFEPPAAELVTISSTAGAAPKLGVGTRTPSQELDIVGNATIAGFMQVGRYADNTARDTAITAPDEGMIVFNQATQKFQGYVADTGLAGGGASNSTPGWVDLY